MSQYEDETKSSMRETGKYGLMRGNRTVFHGRFYTGAKLETVETAKSRPNKR